MKMEEYGEALTMCGFAPVEMQMTLTAGLGGQVMLEATGILDEEQLVSTRNCMKFLHKARKNEQCRDLLQKIEMILELTNETKD